MIYGHDWLLLGNKNFKAQDCIDGVRSGGNVMAGWFANSWKESPGDPYPKAKRILQSEKFSCARVQGFWSYQHKPASLAIVKQQVKIWARLQDEAGKKIYFSPSCEYDKSTPKSLVKQWIATIRAAGLTPVLTPMGGPVVPGVLIEKHGDKVTGSQCFSTDGQSAVDCDFAKLIKLNSTAEYGLAWIPRYNCSVAGANPPPAQRVHAPSVRDIRMVDALFDACTYGDLTGKQLYKLAAEDKGTGDPRANKPLLILKEKAEFAAILDSKGGLLCKFPYYDTYLNDGHRYYSGSGPRLYGYEIAELARKNTGSDVICVRVGTKVYRIGSGQFRHGYYQA